MIELGLFGGLAHSLMVAAVGILGKGMLIEVVAKQVVEEALVEESSYLSVPEYFDLPEHPAH